ncbi:MAG: HD domain-containing protein [Gemmatimonadetes bacterium]|nr:HD domain-containing protein [Gemmatimonadota bacterium]
MTSPIEQIVIRDPLWSNIRIDAEALAIIDSEPFQRLRYVRQLGHAFLVYPGATHSRFEHAIGAYHLARRATTQLTEQSGLPGVPAEEVRLVHLAALLHDIGHYPFSHALEEAGLPSHEVLALVRLRHPGIAGVLAETGIPNPTARVVQLIRGESRSPLQGLISGSMDLDKIEYLRRDARMCGVPYGTVDVDRLLDSLALVSPPGRRPTIGVHERGISALESLLFAKYQMYRNVYWHHAVRSATAMFKRAVRTAIRRQQVSAEWIAEATDETLMERLRSLPDTPIAHRLRRRTLYKRALDLPSSEVPDESGEWIAQKPDIAERLEDRLAADLKLEPGELLIDYPAKPTMLDVDLPVVFRDGQTGPPQLDLMRIAEALHASARRFRVFVAEARSVAAATILELVEKTADEIPD